MRNKYISILYANDLLLSFKKRRTNEEKTKYSSCISFAKQGWIVGNCYFVTAYRNGQVLSELFEACNKHAKESWELNGIVQANGGF